MRINSGLIDGHIHTHGGCGVDNYLRNIRDSLSAGGLDGENLLAVRIASSACTADTEALLAKALMPDRLTVYCNPTFQIEGFDTTPEGVAAQVQDFIDAGADGVKLADGNAGDGVPLDSEVFDPMFSLMEKTGFPLLYHVGYTVRIPERRTFQKNRYPVANFPAVLYHPGGRDDDHEAIENSSDLMEAKFCQIENMLKKHPDLHVTFPHMYYMSDQLSRLSDFIECHKNVMIDMTPCSEIFYNLSKDPKKSREFLCAYSDRLIFGTDNATEWDPLPVITIMKAFFETDEAFFAPAWGFDVRGVAPLPKDVLENIYKKSFFRICEPKTLVPKKTVEFCEKLYDTVRDFPDLPEANKQEILECAKRLREM